MDYVIRKVLEKDNVHIAAIVRTVMPEFGASGADFAIQDSPNRLQL
jgi:putative acetyltransferase